MVQPPLILLLEDEPVLRHLMVRGLVDAGFPVLEGTHGRQGLELAKACHGSLALVISDVTMPIMDGLEFAAKFRTLFPTVPILFITGCPERLSAGSLSRCAVLAKPFGRDQLVTAVHRLLAEPDYEQRVASQ
jgi:two-component system cell cycle sensor histidine kinase/response regulator CckA